MIYISILERTLELGRFSASSNLELSQDFWYPKQGNPAKNSQGSVLKFGQSKVSLLLLIKC